MFVGGLGNISTSTAQNLVRKNYKVGIFKRTLPESPPEGLEEKVQFYRGDRNRVNELAAAIADFKPDIVVDMVCFTPLQAEQIADLLYGKVAQYIFTSTVDVYGYPLSRIPMREIDPMKKPNTKYAADKKACEEIFLARFDKKKFPLTIVRPGYSFGKRSMISLFSHSGGIDLVRRLRAGLPIIVPGNGTTLLQPGCAYDTGRMIAEMVGQPVSTGKSYNCAGEQTITHDEYITLFGRVVDKEPKLVHVPTDVLLSIDSEEIRIPVFRGEKLPCGLLGVLTRFNLSYSVDAFKADFPEFNWELPVEEGIKQFVEWNDKNGTFAKGSVEIWEDKVIKAWRECMKHFKI